jgi:putative sigma-54 modulation protein
MRLILHSQNLPLNSDVAEFLHKHVVRPILRFFDDSAAELSIHLEDSRPRRGGVDQQCRMSFRLPGARTLHVESTREDLRQALLDASVRLKRLMKRELDKMRGTGRRRMHRPLGRTWRERSTRRGTTPGGDPAGL